MHTQPQTVDINIDPVLLSIPSTTTMYFLTPAEKYYVEGSTGIVDWSTPSGDDDDDDVDCCTSEEGTSLPPDVSNDREVDTPMSTT